MRSLRAGITKLCLRSVGIFAGGYNDRIPLLNVVNLYSELVADDHSQAENTFADAPRSDHSLVRRFQDGETDAATAIYLRYAKRLQLLAQSQTGTELTVRFDPEDIVQSVFRTFFRRAAEGHYVIPDGDELWKLLLVIALNKIRARGEYHRAAKRNVSQTTTLATVEPGTLTGQGSPDENAYVVLRMTIDDLFDELPEVQREIVSLRIEGHNVTEISEKTKRSKRTVERVLQSFRTHLSECLNTE